MTEHFRQDHEPPLAIAEWGWRYHHLGIPTDQAQEDEKYLPEYKLYVSGFANNPYGVEWMRYEQGSPVAEIIRKKPHIAFEVDDLQQALQGKQLIGEPNSPAPGVNVAMIIYKGMVIELIQFVFAV
jgi:hypothetical protein